jgi:hypothetical protein
MKFPFFEAVYFSGIFGAAEFSYFESFKNLAYD